MNSSSGNFCCRRIVIPRTFIWWRMKEICIIMRKNVYILRIDIIYKILVVHIIIFSLYNYVLLFSVTQRHDVKSFGIN